MDKLTKEQEDQIHDLPHHDKKCEKRIPINPERLNWIRKKIGREKLDDNETFSDLQSKNEWE